MGLYVLLLSYGFITAVMGVDYVHIVKSVMEADITGNVVLSCKFKEIHLDTWNSLRIHWHKVRRENIIVVHSYYNEGDRLEDQDMEYKGRTQLFHNDLPYGNASLKLLYVKLSDAGNYRCIVGADTGTAYDEGTLKVHVKPSDPVITVVQQDSRFMFHCDTKSIDPHPQVTWHYGKVVPVIPVGDISTSMTSEGLFAVRSSLLLESIDSKEEVCCSVNSADGRQPLQTCASIPENTKDLDLYPMVLLCVVIIPVCMCLINSGKKHYHHQLQIREANAMRKEISKTKDHLITVKVIGLISHGVPSLINSCYYVYKNENVLTNKAKAGENLDRRSFIRIKVNLTDYVAMERTRPLMAEDGHFWNNDKLLYMQQWKQNMNDESLVFIFVIRCDEDITEEMVKEISSLFTDIKTLTGDYPIAVITSKSLGDPSQVKSIFTNLGVKQIFEVDSYSMKDSQRSIEKDLIFLKMIKACLNVTDSRSSSFELEKETLMAHSV